MAPAIRAKLLLDILSSNTQKVTEMGEWAFPVAVLRAWISASPKKFNEYDIMAIVSILRSLL